MQTIMYALFYSAQEILVLQKCADVPFKYFLEFS